MQDSYFLQLWGPEAQGQGASRFGSHWEPLLACTQLPSHCVPTQWREQVSWGLFLSF